LLNITFYNVDQGDAILIDWQYQNSRKIGIIDCNKFKESNKVVEFLSKNSVDAIEFIVLSHFHYDHFSGMSEIFNYCIENKIRINYFLSTLASQVLDIYDQIHYSKKEESEIDKFMNSLELLDINHVITVDCYTNPINLTDEIFLSFFAPDGKAYFDIAKKISRKKNRIVSTKADINRLATIIKIANNKNVILLTSDAIKKSFRKIRSKVNDEVLLVQIPHHGSFKNIDEKFWNSLDFTKECPAVISVGDEPKDKLPDKETIKFFDALGFKIFSTNQVNGINEYFNLPEEEKSDVSSCLDFFSTKVRVVYSKTFNETQFIGDKSFSFF